MKREIRNSKGKLVCKLDDESKVIEIVHKNIITLIKINPEGKFRIKEKK